MRIIFRTLVGFWLCGLLVAARADTFPLADGTSLIGDIVKATDAGVMLRQSDNNVYTNVLWSKLSQDGLRQLANNPKFKDFVEPFIEIPLSERPQKAEVKVNEVTRLELPAKQSFFGALFSSSVGIFALLLIYAANIYAGYEIAVVRARPTGLVMGVAAVLPILGPIIFFAMPMQVEAAPAEEQVEADPATFAVQGQTAPVADEVHVTDVTTGSAPPSNAKSAAGQIFKRGQFTFNRRFIESKFAGFLAETRSPADASTTLILKTAGSQMIVERIVSLAASDMQVEVSLGEVRQEVTIPFADIQEIQLKPKAA